MITAEQFAEWKEHPVTKEIFFELEEVKNDLQKRLSEGQTLSNNAEMTHGMTHKIVGQIDGLNQILNISYEDNSNEDTGESTVSGY